MSAPGGGSTGLGGGGHIDRLARWADRPLIGMVKVADVAVAITVAVVAVQEGTIRPLEPTHRVIWLLVLVLAAEPGLLLFRSTAPWVCLAVFAGLIFVGGAFQIDPGFAFVNTTGDLALWIAVYTVAALGGPRWAVAAIIVEFVAYTPWAWVPNGCDVACNLGWSGFFVFAALAGTAVYQGRLLNQELRTRNDLLRRTRAEGAKLAVREERVRVARDLHDMVAHGLTVAVVQAGAARALVADDPTGAGQALLAVDRAGRDALVELETLMSTMGSAPDSVPGPGPLGGVGSVRTLVDEAIRSGMAIDLTIEAEPASVDPGIDISVYRIVQEALTNVSKHAPGAPASVRIVSTRRAVEVEVIDPGAPGGSVERTIPGAGQGLAGIAERAALFGGWVEAGPTGEGGFRVWARLPREPAAT